MHIWLSEKRVERWVFDPVMRRSWILSFTSSSNCLNIDSLILQDSDSITTRHVGLLIRSMLFSREISEDSNQLRVLKVELTRVHRQSFVIIGLVSDLFQPRHTKDLILALIRISNRSDSVRGWIQTLNESQKQTLDDRVPFFSFLCFSLNKKTTGSNGCKLLLQISKK